MGTRRGTLSFIELPVDTGRRGYMICVPINIGCCSAVSAHDALHALDRMVVNPSVLGEDLSIADFSLLDCYLCDLMFGSGDLFLQGLLPEGLGSDELDHSVCHVVDSQRLHCLSGGPGDPACRRR